MTAEPDGNLPSALRELDDAIHSLTGPQSRLLANRLVQIPSRYTQLADATADGPTNRSGGNSSMSRPPFWIDAFDLIREIDETIECWQPAYTGAPPTVGRLDTLRNRGWRPQDCRRLGDITAAVLEWAADIDQLLNPPPKWTLPSPCPACNTSTVYRRKDGEMVRQPALQIGPNGCFCARCKAHWTPERFVFLARVLGSLPANVLE